MKIKLLLLSFALISFVACNQGSKTGSAGSGSSELASEIDSISYILGADIGDKLKQGGIEELNMVAFSEALVKTLGGDSAEVDMKEGMAKVNAFFQGLYQKKLEKNKKVGEDFLEANKSKEGVQVTESGIQYIVLQEGNGPIPADTNKVEVHYHGTLIDGTVFDSSVEKGEPAKFPVTGVIKGWQEILQLMPVGSKWKVFIPTELAYGQNVRRGGEIEPNMALIFEMELLGIVDPVKEKEDAEKKRKEQEEMMKKQQEEMKKKQEENKQ